MFLRRLSADAYHIILLNLFNFHLLGNNYYFLPLSFFFSIPLSADFTLRSSFLMSSSAGSCSGFIPLLPSSPRTSLLFFTCSSVILASPFKSCCFTLKLVISVANCFAVIVIVGRKSAKGLFSGMPNFFFILLVVNPPNNAQSPLLRMFAKPLLSTPLSYMFLESSVSVAANFSRACNRSLRRIRSSRSSCFRV